MKRMKNYAVALALLAALVATTTPAAWAQDETKPFAVVSIAGWDKLSGAVSNVLQAAGQAEIDEQFKAMAATPPGITTTQPWGVVVQMDGMVATGYAFIPVSDSDAALQQAMMFAAMANPMGPPPEMPEPDAEGVLTLGDENNPLYLLPKGDWLFVSPRRDALLGAPEDPTPLLEGLETQYTIAAKLSMQNVPDMTKQGLLGMLGMMAGAAASDESQQQMIEQSLEGLKMWMEGADTTLIAITVADDGELTIDVEATAVAGSQLADEIAASGPSGGAFASLADDSALLSLAINQKISPYQQQQLTTTAGVYKDMVLDSLSEQDLSDNDREIAEKMVNEIAEVAVATIQSGAIEAGMSLSCDGEQYMLVGGKKIADAEKAESVVKQIVGLVTQENEQLKEMIQLDAETYNGVRLHTFSMPTAALGPGGPPSMQGKFVAVVLGFGDDMSYVRAVLGAQDLASVVDAAKADLDGDGADPTAPAQKLTICAGQIPDTFQVAGAPMEMFLGDVTPTDADKLTITANVSGVKQSTKIVLTSGMIKIIGQGVKAAAANMGGPDFGEEMMEIEEEGFGGDSDPFGN